MRQDETPRLRGFARDMRSAQTDAEAVMWDALRNRRLDGLKFRRQVPYSGYIVDFLCVERGLVVEIDGSQHGNNARDAKRDHILAEHGLLVLRFWNDDVLKTLDDVCNHIVAVARER